MDAESRRLLDEICVADGDPREYVRIVYQRKGLKRTAYGYFAGLLRKKGRWWYAVLESYDGQHGEDIYVPSILRIMPAAEGASVDPGSVEDSVE